MPANKQWLLQALLRAHRSRELSSDHSSRARSQRLSQKFLIGYKHQIILRCRLQTGDAGNLHAAVAHHASAGSLSNLIKRTLHRSHSIAATKLKASLLPRHCRVIVKRPEPAHPVPPVKVHVPEIVLPFAVPESVSVLPEGEPESTLKPKLPFI